MTEIIVRGSNGDIGVHGPSGHILWRDHFEEHGAEYADILYFDPARWPDYAHRIHECDILDTAFVASGRYTAELPRTAEGEWSDTLRLPAPQVTIILHGWCWDRYWDAQLGDEVVTQTHEHEFPDRAPDGWCVYTRREGPADWQDPSDFDLTDEQDFPTLEEARAEAQRRAADYGIGYFED